MANTVKAKVVEIARQGCLTTLEDYLSLHTYPVETFLVGDSDLKTAVATGLVYLKSVGTGAVIVSKQQDRPYLKATVRTLEDNSVTVNYVAKNYRFPINDEKVPILDVSWGVGDIILNNDYTRNQCFGWVCKEAGVPGVWHQFGNIGPYYNYIEELDYLPEPSVLQIGRQVRYTQGTKQGLFICRWDGSKPVWAEQDYLMGPEDERPETALNGTWYYNTTVDRYEWYSEKDSKWYRFEQMEAEFAKWNQQVNDIISKLQKDFDAKVVEWDKTFNDKLDALTEEFTKKLQSTIDELIAAANKKIDDLVKETNDTVDQLIKDSQARIDEAVKACDTATERANTAAKTVEDNQAKLEQTIRESVMIWKPLVNSYSDIATTYPNPEQGWTVSTADKGETYRYDAVTGTWVKIQVTPSAVITKSEATAMFKLKEEFVSMNLSTTWPNTATLEKDTTNDDFIEVFLDPSASDDVKYAFNDLGLKAELTDARTITFTYSKTVNKMDIPIIIRVGRV